MHKSNFIKQLLYFVALLPIHLFAQTNSLNWDTDGNSYTSLEANKIIRIVLPSMQKTVIVDTTLLKPSPQLKALKIRSYQFSVDGKKVLIYTNSKKVWRQDTRGDYWVLTLDSKELIQIGKNKPVSSLMFAKFSPDGLKVAYVSGHNLYVEDLTKHTTKPLTTDGTTKLINGTFDWVYEEEFNCRDGFQWSPDSKAIAYWQINANTIRDYLMLNTTDSIYSQVVPVEYPKVGEKPSACKVGVVTIGTAKTVWMNVAGEATNNYIPRMAWRDNTNELLIQQLNRKQNESKLIVCDAATGKTKTIYTETDEAWINVQNNGINNKGWNWLNKGTAFLWESEKDGWNHVYSINKEGKETLITTGEYDVIELLAYNEATNIMYFTASPDNATQQYLYKTTLDGKGKAERLSPINQAGTHNYNISPTGKFAEHQFSSSIVFPVSEIIALPEHKAINDASDIEPKIAKQKPSKKKVAFLKLTTEDNVTVDAWMVKPYDFDSTKKYPIVFLVYTEPASATVRDNFGAGNNGLYTGDMAKDGYIYVSIDGRGTPSPKGRAWRKAIYRKIGQINIRDQAMAAKELLKRPYIDPTRVAVHGWSGGGSTTLNLLFQYPEIYQTGIAVAAVANQLSYDNIYQERYMGIPQENREDFVQGSPITHAKNLKGNLLYIHGTGDDNVHYQNAEMLVNELIKHNKQFQFMAYPNRSHGIYEGEGTRRHLNTLFTNYLKQYCPPGGR